MSTAMDLKPNSVYKLSDVAIELDVSLRTLQRAVEAGKLHAVRTGRYIFVSGRNLLAWLEAGNEPKVKVSVKKMPEEAAQG